MEKEQNNIKEQEHHSNFILGEKTFSKFSKEIFRYPIFGIICGLYLNFIYINNWKKRKNLFSIFIFLYINYLIIKIIIKKIFRLEEGENDEKNKKCNYEFEMNKRREIFRKIISLEDPCSTIRAFLYTYLCLLLSRLLGDRFIILIILNIYIFYSPINHRYPDFIFTTIMSVKQTIEAIFGIIECFIPRYIEKKEKSN